MLSKPNRLTRDRDFKNVISRGRSGYNQTLGLKVVKNNLATSRFGISISIKVSKTAINRNRIKRQIREISKTELKKFKGNYDIVIIARPGIDECSYGEIKASLVANYKKFGLY